MNLSKADILKYLKTDRAILVLCILAALIFWLTNKMSETFQSEGEVALQYEIPPGRVMTSALPKSIKVLYEGSGWDLLRNKQLNDVQIEVQNRRSSHFTKDQIIDLIKEQNPDNVTIDDINISYFDVTLEEQFQKKIPVELVEKIKLVDQYFLKSVKLVPDSVTISGPENLIDQITKWETKVIDLKGVKNSTTLDVNLKSFSELEGDEVVTFSPNTINVQLEVEQYTEKSLFIPIHITNGPDSLKIFPAKIKLDCKVSLNDYDKISFKDFQAEVNLKDVVLDGQNNTIPVVLSSQPSNVSNIRFNPKSVEFFFVAKLEVIEEE